MSLTTIVENVADELGLVNPTSVTGSADANIKLVLRMVNREGKHLARRYRFQELRREATITTVAAEDQGDIDTIAPGFLHYIQKSAWNRTEQLRLEGPIPPAEWQALKARNINSSIDHFTFRNGEFLAYPSPAASQTWAFEYFSKNWCADSVGAEKAQMDNNNDVALIDETLIELGVIWRWLKNRGLDYSEEKRDYEVAIKQAAMSDMPMEIVMGASVRAVQGDVSATGPDV